MADEYHTTPTKNLVSFKDLNRILQFEIFLHKDGQLKVAHVILGYKPSTKRFQSPKNVIKARDSHLALIDVAVPSFLLIKPPPEETQDAQLLAPLAAKLHYSQEPPIPYVCFYTPFILKTKYKTIHVKRAWADLHSKSYSNLIPTLHKKHILWASLNKTKNVLIMVCQHYKIEF